VLPMRPDLLKGHLDGLLLAVLEPGPQHGYAVIEALRTGSDGALDLPTGTVYPALRRLERATMLSGSWSTVGGRERRTYTLTRTGRHALARQRDEWTEFAAVVEAVLRPRGAAAAGAL